MSAQPIPIPALAALRSHLETIQSQAWREYGAWFEDVAHALDSDTDEVDVTTWTEWYGEGLTATQAVKRYGDAFGVTG